jgi:hypothetical protein
MFDAIGQIGGVTAFADDLQVLYALADCDAQLMDIDHARKGDTGVMPRGGLGQEIVIPSEQNSAQLTGTVEQCGIVQPRGAIGLSGEHVHIPRQQRSRDDRRHVNVHVKCDAHSLPAARNRWRRGELAT